MNAAAAIVLFGASALMAGGAMPGDGQYRHRRVFEGLVLGGFGLIAFGTALWLRSAS